MYNYYPFEYINVGIWHSKDDVDHKSNSCDKLELLLADYNLGKDCYNILKENGYTLDVLKNDVHLTEVNEFCNALKIVKKQKFKEFMESLSNEKQQKYDKEISIAVLGDKNAGKSWLIERYVHGKKPAKDQDEKKEIKHQKYEKLGNEIIKLNIKEFSENENGKLKEMVQQGNIVILLCFNEKNNLLITSRRDYWKKKLLEFKNKSSVIMLVGCQLDIAPQNRKEEDKHIAAEINRWKSLNISYFRCSAKTGENVRNVFMSAVQMNLQNDAKWWGPIPWNNAAVTDVYNDGMNYTWSYIWPRNNTT
eukprot:188680_1